MVRFSIRALLLVTTAASLLFFVAFVPRGSITPETLSRLHDGMTIVEASEIIGVCPGWHDGIDGLGGLDFYSKSRPGVCWVNLHGAIVADSSGVTIWDIKFIPKSQYNTHVNFSTMIYSRSLERLVDWKSPIATAIFLFAAYLFAMLPVAVVAWVYHVSLLDLALFGATMTFLVIAGFGACSTQFWWHHRTPQFHDLALLIAGTTFLGTTGILVVRLWFRSENIDDVP